MCRSGSMQPFERAVHQDGKNVFRPALGLARNDGNGAARQDLHRLDTTRCYTVQGFPAAPHFVGTGFRRVVGFVQ